MPTLSPSIIIGVYPEVSKPLWKGPESRIDRGVTPKRSGGAMVVTMKSASAWLAAAAIAAAVVFLAVSRGPEAFSTRVGQPAPEITGGPWINSEPLTMEKLRGRVVAVEFWTYG
jgi:hypothetical protein